MSIQRDYLLTMIEKLGELVREVMKRGGSPERTQVRIDELGRVCDPGFPVRVAMRRTRARPAGAK